MEGGDGMQRGQGDLQGEHPAGRLKAERLPSISQSRLLGPFNTRTVTEYTLVPCPFCPLRLSPDPPPPSTCQVQSTVNSLPRLRTQKAQRTLAWIREAAATSSGGRLMHPANLAKMMALQRLRAATFAEEGRLRSFRTAAVQSTLARPASGRAGSAKTPSPPTGSKRRKSTAPQEAHAG